MNIKTSWLTGSFFFSIAILSSLNVSLAYDSDEKESFHPEFVQVLKSTLKPNYVERTEPSPPKSAPGSLGFAKVAVIHWAPAKNPPVNSPAQKIDSFKQEMSRELEVYIREAARNGAKLVVAPEFSYVGYPDLSYKNKAEVRPFAEYRGSPMETKWSRLAQELQIYLVVGYPILGAGPDEIRNTMTVWNPKGVALARYNKMHLYAEEWRYIDAGTTPVTVDTPFGKLGLLICADMYGSRGPVPTYIKNNVDLYIVPTSWASGSGIRYFASLARWVNKTVLISNHTYLPDAAIIDGDGSAQSYLNSRSGVAYGYVKLVRPL